MAAETRTPPDVVQLFSDLVFALVDEPEQITISVEVLDKETVIRVRAPAKEVGKIVGSGGRTARSLRVLLAAVGAGRKKLYSMDVKAVGQ